MGAADDQNIEDLAAAIRDTARIEDLIEQMLEVAAIVEETLAPVGVHPIVVGGLALAYWITAGTYLTGDIDVVMPAVPEAEQRLEKLGFEREGRYWTLPGREIIFEAPGTYLEPSRAGHDGYDLVETRTGRLVRVQAPEDVFGGRFGEFIAHGHAEVFQPLLWLLGSDQMNQKELEGRAEEPEYLKQLGISKENFLRGLKILREYVEKLQSGEAMPEMWQIHEIAASLR
jgi:hypothetical protein